MRNDKTYADLAKKPIKPPVTKEELADAMKRFLESGGKVKQYPNQPKE